jgi:hypothetical protein
MFSEMGVAKLTECTAVIFHNGVVKTSHIGGMKLVA